MRPARRLAVIAIALSIHVGCFPEQWSRRTHNAMYAVDAGVAVLGAAMLVGAHHCQSDPLDDCDIALNGYGLVSIGGAVLGAVVNLFMVEHPFWYSDPPPPPPPGLERIAVEAAAAARLGHCDAAREQLRTIFRQDPAYFDEVIAAEPVLARCLRGP